MDTLTTNVATTSQAPDLKTRVANAVAALSKIESDLGLPQPEPLTAKQRRQLTRARKGGEKVIPSLASIAQKYGVNLPMQPTAEMLSASELASQLEPLQKQLVSLSALVDSNAGTARSAAWSTATTLYGVLKRMAHRDVQLSKLLEPVAALFSYRHPLVRAQHPKQKGKKAALAAEKQQQQHAAASPAPAAEVPAPPSPGPANETKHP